jgi:uncharacterized protein YndB with AHSA1/START domain
MEKLTFNKTINASREKVWDVLWSLDSYRQWTAVFSPSSDVETSWEKGAKVLFTDGSGSGMVSRIADKIPNEFMSFEHLGEVTNGVEDTTSDKVKAWAGSHENYTLTDVDGKTELLVEIDMAKEYVPMFEKTWPQAMDKIQELAERN